MCSFSFSSVAYQKQKEEHLKLSKEGGPTIGRSFVFVCEYAWYLITIMSSKRILTLTHDLFRAKTGNFTALRVPKDARIDPWTSLFRPSGLQRPLLFCGGVLIASSHSITNISIYSPPGSPFPRTWGWCLPLGQKIIGAWNHLNII